MMRLETFKILLVIALHREWAIKQWDVVAAYLQPHLHHDVYITDVNEDGEIEYWKLNKVLYGLKQAGHEWFKTLSGIMSTFRIYQCIGDEGTCTDQKNTIIIGTHVGDLIGIAPSEAQLDQTERAVVKRVELDKRGKPAKILGMELHWEEEQVALTQTSLIDSLASSSSAARMAQWQKRSLPLNTQSYEKSDQTDKETSGAIPKYQSIIGGLLFIARITRPEISIHVNLLGCGTKNHTHENWEVALRVLRYLYSTKHDGLPLKKAGDLKVKIYADASYGEGSRSQTGVMMTMGHQLIG